MSKDMPPSARRAVVLFAHGSRDPLWHAPMLAVASRVRTVSPDTQVLCAYLELTPPDLPSVVTELVATGVAHISVVPMFLGVGRHAREDLPELVSELRAAHPAVHIELQRAVGEDPRLIELLADIAIQALPS